MKESGNKIRSGIRNSISGLLILLIASCNVPRKETEQQVSGEKPVILKLEQARQFLTAEGTEYRIKELNTLKFAELKQPDEHFPTIMLDAAKTFQTIEGFGGALTDASAETFYKLPAAKQQEILESYFNTEKGIGYSLCRTHINSCDFSSESYAYSEVEGDTELKHFSINHDKKFRIPFIKATLAQTDGTLKLLASPWSPPAWMKTNNNMLQGGKLKPEYFQTWADYYVKFVREYEKEGIPFWAISVQNEPMAIQTWESCIYTAEEERDFVKNYLGPTLHKSGLENLKLIIWDHNRGLMVQRAGVVYDDPEASKYVWGTGFHWYTGDHFENVKLHQESFPDKKTLFTEGCVFPFNLSNVNEWHWAERYGESIIHDLNNSAVGWIDWNVIVDETGGPNHVSNFCFAPVVGNTRTGEVIYMSSFYYLGHFSKFIKPGAKRIICSSNFDELMATAMLNPDGSIAVVVMNRSDKNIEFKTCINQKAVKNSSPAHSIITMVIN